MTKPAPHQDPITGHAWRDGKCIKCDVAGYLATADPTDRCEGGIQETLTTGTGITHTATARDGDTFDQKRDGVRLAGQHARVKTLMADGTWRTLAAIAAATGDPEASISARLRDLRKPQHGGHRVERRHRGGGLWEYRMEPT